jgi:hypothetical protein
MNSRKTGPGSEMNITLTMIWCQVVIQHFGVVQNGVIIHFRSTNLTHAQMIESHADFASDVTILFNNNLF